jgi:hypothetical protein
MNHQRRVVEAALFSLAATAERSLKKRKGKNYQDSEGKE